MKKYVVLGIGITMMLFGMGLNLHYALDDYGLGNKNVAITVMAQSTKTGETGTTEDGWTSMSMPCFDKNGITKGNRLICYQPGYKQSCSETNCK